MSWPGEAGVGVGTAATSSPGGFGTPAYADKLKRMNKSVPEQIHTIFMVTKFSRARLTSRMRLKDRT